MCCNCRCASSTTSMEGTCVRHTAVPVQLQRTRRSVACVVENPHAGPCSRDAKRPSTTRLVASGCTWTSTAETASAPLVTPSGSSSVRYAQARDLGISLQINPHEKRQARDLGISLQINPHEKRRGSRSPRYRAINIYYS